jgi:hypothetical protein
LGSVEVAGVQVAAPAPMVATADTREADAAWASLAPQLDSTWEPDWAATIRLLDGSLQHWPTYAVAQDKLYAALVADAQVKLQAGQAGDGVAEVERAARLLPERPEAWVLLAQLATSASPERGHSGAVIAAPAGPRRPPQRSGLSPRAPALRSMPAAGRQPRMIARKVQDLEQLDKSVRTSPTPACRGQPGSEERHGSRPGTRIAEQGASPLGDAGSG